MGSFIIPSSHRLHNAGCPLASILSFQAVAGHRATKLEATHFPDFLMAGKYNGNPCDKFGPVRGEWKGTPSSSCLKGRAR